MTAQTTKQPRRLWITWEIQRRNRSMSRALGAELHELISEKPRLIRYFVLMWATWRIVQRAQPDILFVQNPSIVLSLFAVIVRKFKRLVLVVDAHNSGLFPLEGRSRLLNGICRYIARNADYVLVSNDALAEICAGWGANAFVMPDPLPQFELPQCCQRRARGTTPSSKVRLVFICSWSDDEPFEALLEAAKHIDSSDISIAITGNAPSQIKGMKLPDCIQLTGFISDFEYVRLLAACDGVVVLTTRKNCLNCGAYEAVALGKPGVLSDDTVLKGYFGNAFLYTDNSVKNIAQIIGEFRNFLPTLKINTKKIKEMINCREKKRMVLFNKKLSMATRGLHRKLNG